MGKKRNAYRLLVGKPEGNRQLGRPRRGWVDNIRMDFGDVGWGDVDWIGLPLVILHHLQNVSVQLANKRGLKKKLFTFCSPHVNALVIVLSDSLCERIRK
jgi:hypothetical protein